MGALVCLMGMILCMALLMALPAIINKQQRDELDNWDKYEQL